MGALSIEKLTSGHDLSSFDCDDDDLNEFIKVDALHYQEHLLTTTYLLLTEGEIIAFFSLHNDRIHVDDADRKKWNRLGRKIPNLKRRSSYPAVKIGRLGVKKGIQRGGYGTKITDYVKINMGVNSPCGCRFITVDAYNNQRALSFYTKMGFEFLRESDDGDKTRLMYYDLKQISNPVHGG